MALVEGDAGVGKTRLVSAILSDAEWRGFQVGLGKADPLAISAPYQLLRDALSPLMTPLRITQLAELVEPAQLSAVTPLFPIIAEHLPDLPSLVPLDPQEEQGRLWDGLAQCIVGLASVAPLLLILEDLHWADETTLAALLHLTHCLPANRAFIILTYRTAEARERTAVWEALEALDRALPLLRLCLLPFERVEAVALIQRALGTGEADARSVAFAQRLQDETGGNALFLVETLKSLLEQGSLSQPSEGGWLFPARDLPLPAPASVQELIVGRLARLVPPLRSVLEQVAVLGDDADFPVLSEAGGTDHATLLVMLEELGWRGFLVEDEAEARYRFEHDRIRETVYRAIAPERCRTLHRQAGAALRQQHPERAESLARHSSLGEVWDEAVDYSRRAGDQARAIYAGGEAISYYAQALEAWEHLQPLDEELGMTLYQARGEVCQETGRFDQAEADFRVAHDLAEQIGDEAGQARALNRLSYLRFQKGDFESTIAIAEAALGLAMAVGLQSEIAAALFNKANAIRNLGHYREAIEPYEQAAAIFERLDEQVRLADCLNRMGFALLFTGDCAGTLSIMERGLAIRRRLDDRVGISYSLINLSYLYSYQGQFASAERAAREALEVANTIGDPYGEDAALHCLGLAILEQGDPARAIPLFQRALEIARRIGDRPLEPEALAGLGEANHYLGHPEQAQEALEHSLRMASVSVEIEQVPEIHTRLARLFLTMNRGEEALAHVRAGLEIAQELEEPRSLGLTHRMMGEMTVHLGSDEAATYFEESVRILREIGAEAELARSLAAYGLYLNRSADAGKARHSATMLDEARRLFQKLGMARDLAQLEAETGACLQPGQVKVRLPHVDAPTGRPLRDDEFVEVAWMPRRRTTRSLARPPAAASGCCGCCGKPPSNLPLPPWWPWPLRLAPARVPSSATWPPCAPKGTTCAPVALATDRLVAVRGMGGLEQSAPIRCCAPTSTTTN
jgi:tetratricopeptide (TPR) repeat protein